MNAGRLAELRETLAKLSTMEDSTARICAHDYREMLDEIERLTKLGQELAAAEEEYQQFIPPGHHIVEDGDGERFVKNDSPATADLREAIACMKICMMGQNVPDEKRAHYGEMIRRLERTVK